MASLRGSASLEIRAPLRLYENATSLSYYRSCTVYLRGVAAVRSAPRILRMLWVGKNKLKVKN